MTLSNIANIRLISQQIASTKFKSAKEIVSWMGAMQAQDYKMAKWAIGVRLQKTTEKSIESAIDSGEIIRTHILRPTWHFVSSNDIYWMLELSAPRLKAAQKSREKQLELSEKIFKKTNAILEQSLSGHQHLSRQEILKMFTKAKIGTDDNRLSHILVNAELEGIICSGKTKDKQITYALLDERVPRNITLNRDEALSRLANKYFESHCPATLNDFIWWSGLSVSNAKNALEMIKPGFVSEKINEKIYWFPESFSFSKRFKESVFFLPAFDEFLISYKDRSAALSFSSSKKVFSNNGIFWPTIIINGKVCGLWKRTIKKNKIIVAINFFKDAGTGVNILIDEAIKKFGHFWSNKIEVIYH